MRDLRPLFAFIALALPLMGGLMREAAGFSLLGPFRDQSRGAPDPWQGRPYGGRPGGIGYSLLGDIGGPMLVQEGYRWNVPVITYGIDPSFTEYFGPSGVQEVEKAISIFNALPAASAMSPTLEEVPLETLRQNHGAEAVKLLDLKSHVLALLLEQLGLANPERFVWSLRARQVSELATNYMVLNLNYDPLTLSASHRVNGVIYNYVIHVALGAKGEEWASAVEWFQLDPLLLPYRSVAGGLGSTDARMGSTPDSILFGTLPRLIPGIFLTGLTRDDVGGLHFLLSKLNRQWERLLPGVSGVGPNAQNFVNAAQRPGVEKLTFQRQPYLAAEQRFQPVTNVFADVYFTNDVATTQMLQRVVTTPDILFRVADLGGRISRFRDWTFFSPHLMDRSDTSAWINHAELNGRSGGGGPGIIRPPIHITFNKLGRYYAATGGFLVDRWGAYDASDAPPVVLSDESDVSGLVVQSRLVRTNNGLEFEWTTLKIESYRCRVEISTNLIHWTPFTTIELFIDANAFTLRHPVGASPAFFRSIQELPEL